MNGIGGVPQTLQTLAPSYALLGKSAAGLESPENKDQTLPPVEETSAGEKNRNQPHQKADAVSSDGGDARHDHHQPQETAETEQPRESESVVTDVEISSYAQVNAQDQLQIALQRAATLHSETHKSAAGIHAVDSFSEAAGYVLMPGLLLDQRS